MTTQTAEQQVRAAWKRLDECNLEMSGDQCIIYDGSPCGKVFHSWQAALDFTNGYRQEIAALSLALENLTLCTKEANCADCDIREPLLKLGKAHLATLLQGWKEW